MADVCCNKQIVKLVDSKLSDHVDFKLYREDILSQMISNKFVCSKVVLNVRLHPKFNLQDFRNGSHRC